MPGSTVTSLADCELATHAEVLTAFQTCKSNAGTTSKDQFALYRQASDITFFQVLHDKQPRGSMYPYIYRYLRAEAYDV